MGLSAKITVFLISQKIISAKDRDVYEYGFDLLIADCINFSLILLIGILWSQLKETVIYLIIFVGLRSVCGGYHAKTHCKCHICTIGAYIFFLFLQYILQDHITMSLLGDCIAAVPIILFAPITHANKPLSKQIYQRNRIASIVFTIGLITLASILSIFQYRESITISSTLWIVSLCMIPAINIHSLNSGRKSI